MIKRDGAVLVHRPTGYDPVNWQPGGSRIQTRIKANKLIIRAVRSNPHELLTLTFTQVDLGVKLDLVDNSEFILHASEKEMQRAVMLYPHLVEPGFHPITYEKRVKPGFIDVFGRDERGKLVIIEIKRKTCGRDAVIQLWTYLESLRKTESSKLRGILMAPNLAKGALRLLETMNLEFKTLSPKKCAELLRNQQNRTLTSFLITKTEHDSK
jgi:RecB family endonuclease NucS